ncbi:galactose oxidase [Rhizophagus irregularis]|uniref:Galactose oxidase n=1 Tax=Rhizophagus irregularis TaxID=588596 RepID=A0A2N1MGZ3_9GLOM|nr:galactose oxidase [Rhizophagus irregularis]
MSQKNLMYVTLWLLVQLLVVEINCQMSAPYKPKTREKHTATLIDNKLYILSGRENTGIDVGKDFFYLEIPDKFNTQNLIWKDLSNIDILLPHYGAAAVKGGVDNNTLILYGGTNDTGAMDLVYTYSLQSNSWSIPKITGDDNLITIRKESLSGIVDNKGKMYLWAGSDDVSKKFHYVNNMLILDTINLNMGKGSSIGAPSGRSLYGATLLSDNTIIYMGGHTDIEQLLTLNPVYLYNTINDSWSTKTTSGNIPSGRVGLSVVPGLDDKRVIIFGGTPFTTDYADLTPEDSIYELSLDNFEWRIPKTSGQIPKSRMFHKANVIGKYMVISFGN